ncbi:hypothetical protein [Microbacterium sp. ZW T5_56]|uniref:hypothetical protein n=1 Tax=Microbacterium sp. ZW T5_56 TaxID=3378081 RepID=UPI00385336F1
MVTATLIAYLDGLDANEGVVTCRDAIHAFDGRILRTWDAAGAADVRDLDAPGATLLAVHADTAVLSDDTGTLIDRGGAEPTRIPVRADAAVPVADGWLLTEPRDRDNTGWSQSHAIVWVDATGEIRSEHILEVFGARPSGVSHPTEPAALLEFPMGQDGTLLAAVRVVGDELEVTELLGAEDPVIGGFSPDGSTFLVLPYPSDPDVALIASWPSGDVIARVSATDLDLERGFDLTGGYLGADRVVLLATETGPVLAASDLSGAALIELIGLDEIADEDSWISQVFPVGNDSFVIGVTDGGDTIATLWRIS